MCSSLVWIPWLHLGSGLRHRAVNGRGLCPKGVVALELDKLPGKLSTKIRTFDWIGSVVFVASTVSFLIPVTWGKYLVLCILSIYFV